MTSTIAVCISSSVLVNPNSSIIYVHKYLYQKPLDVILLIFVLTKTTFALTCDII
jgi:hypothetical protein